MLRGQQRQDVDGAFAILQFGDAEGFGGSAHFLGQRHQLIIVGRNLTQRGFHIGEGGEHGLAVIGDLFLLLGDGEIVLRLQPAAVEDRLQQRSADAPGEIARIDQAADRGAGIAAAAGQADLREESGARRIHIGVGGKQIGFRFRHRGIAQQQFGRHAALQAGRHEAVQILRLDVETFGRLAEQNSQGIAGFAFLLDQAGQARFLGGDHRLFLGQIQIGRHAIGHFGLHDGENALGGLNVLAGDDDAFARRQDGEILLRHAGRDRKADHRLGVAGGAQIFARLIETVAIKAPEIRRIAGGQTGAEIVGGGFDAGARRLHDGAARSDGKIAGGAVAAGALGLALKIDGGQQVGEGDAVLGFGFQHARGGGGEVEIFLLGRVHQARQFVGLEIDPPIGFRPDRGLFVGHRRGERLGNVSGAVQGGRVGCGAASRHQGNHADGKAAENRFHRTLIESK